MLHHARYLLSSLLVVSCSLAIPVQAESSGKRSPKAISLEQFEKTEIPKLQALVTAKDFAGIEKLLAEERTKSELLSDWSLTLEVYYKNLSHGVEGIGYDDRRQYSSFLDAWRKSFPNSMAEHLLRIKFLKEQAWHARGEGYANTVSESGRSRFRALMEEAYAELISAQKLETPEPELHTAAVTIIGPTGAPKNVLYREAVEAVKLDPRSTRATYSAGLYLLPRWGHAANEVVRFAEVVAEAAGEEYGDIQYASIAATTTAAEGERVLHTQNEFSWPRIEKGFKSIRDKVGDDDYIINYFALVAYRFQKRDAAKEAFTHIDGRWTERRARIWDDRQFLEFVRGWAEGSK